MKKQKQSNNKLITKNYFEWQSSVLEAEYRGSIVDKHSGDTGANRENIVCYWFLKHLPKTVSSEVGGKIIDGSDNISKQIDIIIYNNALPRFGANKKSYYFAEGVVAAIQVKSILTSGELNNSIKNLDSVKKCVLQKTRRIGFGNSKTIIPTGIFAFEMGYVSISNLIKALEKKKNSPIDFVYINRTAFIVYNKGTWHITNDDRSKKRAKEGYLLVEKSNNCLWRLMLELSSKAFTDTQFLYDFQGYFIKDW